MVFPFCWLYLNGRIFLVGSSTSKFASMRFLLLFIFLFYFIFLCEGGDLLRSLNLFFFANLSCHRFKIDIFNQNKYIKLVFDYIIYFINNNCSELWQIVNVIKILKFFRAKFIILCKIIVLLWISSQCYDQL